MGVVQQFNALIWSWAEMLRALRRRVAFGPFLVYAGVQTVVLLLVAGFTVRPFSLFVPALMRWRFGEEALHYPNNFMVLRGAMGDVDTVLAVLLGALVTAAGVHLFSSFYAGTRVGFREGMRAGWAAYAPALVIAVIVALLSHLAFRVPLSVWGGLADSNPMRFRLLRLLLVGVVLVIQSVFVFAVPAVVAGGKRLGEALGSTLAISLRNPIIAFLIVAVPAALELLPAWIMRNSALIIYRFSPEFLTVGMLIWIVVILFINYATVGAATRFYLHATVNEGPSAGSGEGQ